MEKQHHKDFAGWHELKAKLDGYHKAPTFQEREVWGCCIGINVGHEVDGKNKFFDRPVLVIRKFNKNLFWGVPLSTQIKDNPHYHRVHVHGKEQCVLLTHLRLYDGKRITDKMGKLSQRQFEPIQAKLMQQLVRK